MLFFKLADYWMMGWGDTLRRYKGMSFGGPPKTPSKVTPQSTGFSQISGRPVGAGEGVTAAMSVLLSWHEKVVEVAGIGSIVRCMSDRRQV